MTTFYIVRHGESEGNAKPEHGVVLESKPLGSELTELGVQQAEKLAKELEPVYFDLAFSSDLIRADRTAEIILQERNLTHKTLEILRERSRGQIVGELEKELARGFHGIFEALEVMTQQKQHVLKEQYNVELREETTTRLIIFLRESAIAYPGKTILVVCHGAVMRALLIHFGFGTPAELGSGTVTNTGYFILDSDGVDFFLKETYGVNKRVTN